MYIYVNIYIYIYIYMYIHIYRESALISYLRCHYGYQLMDPILRNI